jgi:D-alanyl-D-alanine carboxypeptidase (penicillin-binding protein 5/6)
LIVLYQQHGKEFLICSLGSQSDSSRYDDVNFILKTINESYYLTQ